MFSLQFLAASTSLLNFDLNLTYSVNFLFGSSLQYWHKFTDFLNNYHNIKLNCTLPSLFQYLLYYLLIYYY